MYLVEFFTFVYLINVITNLESVHEDPVGGFPDQQRVIEKTRNMAAPRSSALL